MDSGQAIILASESPRRKMLLEQLQLDFKIVPSNLSEMPPMGERPNAYAARMSLEKALKVAEEHPDDIVIGADTVVSLGEKIMGKPANKEEAHLMLSILSGHWHEVWTGVSVIHLKKRFEVTTAVKSEVCFRDLSMQEIDTYIATGEPMDKAGSYAIQGKGRNFVREIKGSYHNIVGLPTMELCKILEKAGIQIDSTATESVF